MTRFKLRPAMAFALCAVFAIGLVSAACGDDDDDGGGSNQEVIDAMVAEGATEEEARCFVDELGSDAERLFTAADEDLSEDDLEALFDAIEACDIE